MSEMAPHSAPTAPKKPAARSRISNGHDVLAGVDQRTAIARRYRDIVEAVSLDQGGANHLSETRRQLIRRLAGSAVMAEAMEAKLANGQEIDINQYALLTSTIVRVAQRIGVDRRLRNVTPSLNQYLARRTPPANGNPNSIDADGTE